MLQDIASAIFRPYGLWWEQVDSNHRQNCLCRASRRFFLRPYGLIFAILRLLWWEQVDSNHRQNCLCRASRRFFLRPYGLIFAILRLLWWEQVDSNHRPHAYQACALTS